ncbi:MAG: pyruvate:ferredoxin (flavodoxin) oxidoreductase [Capsulimonadaceae bacterium]|nr:pyruvate:ferredoxin (flavodoxin) oxidoreductase [Capsulimonadaceae bacterium]
MVTVDGNEAAAYVAYKTNEVVSIYPITPSTPMAELSDAWAAKGERNLWGSIPLVQEMQSEGGAAGACHGALQTGALTTTFTASQGLLLMIPNMYKIAGELTPAVFHITARSLAAQALSIFGDHADVMACRATGWAMLFSGSVQEVTDFALVAQASTLRSRIPFIHAFDGFRTSHEVVKIEQIPVAVIRKMIDDDLVRAHRQRALSPDHPVIRGTAQNPDVYFQGREASNPFYLATPNIVQEEFDKFAALTGRQYHLFDYVGAPDAEQVIVAMASGTEAIEETVEYLVQKGAKVGLVKVRLFRPLDTARLIAALPSTVKTVTVLDRTKEPGSVGEPLYQDVITAVEEAYAAGKVHFAARPRIIGGRYGLSSKEFTPAMIKAIYEESAKANPKNHFTVGIDDDVTHASLPYDASFDIESDDTIRALFFGLGSDGTVGANKNSIKIIGEETDNYAQGYFVYDSKKSGSITISHLRFGPRPIKSTYLIKSANFVAIHQFEFLETYPVLDGAKPGATVLLNSLYGPDEVWQHLPAKIRKTIIDKKLKLWVLDGLEVAKKTGMGVRINTIMQTAFFAISGVLPKDEAIAQIKKAIKKTYGRRGEAVVQKNFNAVDQSLAHLSQVAVPAVDPLAGKEDHVRDVYNGAPDFVREFTAELIAGRGDDVPVSKMPVDGTFPVGTTKWEKRNIANEVPVWNEDLCIQCGKCVLVCPHAVVRAKVWDPATAPAAASELKSVPAKFREFPGKNFTIQVGVEDCTGCALCIDVCPAKDKSNVSRKALEMAPQIPLRETEPKKWETFLALPEAPRDGVVKYNNVKNVQLLQPLFEFSGACTGCGETAYVKLLSQLFGDRAVIANATGCSSIYGGNLPTTPYTTNPQGRGPAWANSLFEDNAEFGMGMRMTFDQQKGYARRLVQDLRETIGADLADGILNAVQTGDEGLAGQWARVTQLKNELSKHIVNNGANPVFADLLAIADSLVDRSVWILGGDGWAYDIGYGGLDHVIASGPNVNILVLDTEVYSNTGGQASKSTARGAVAKFTASGKRNAKKDLARLAMSYGNVYVGAVSLGAKDQHTVKTFLEAESYDGPSLVIAYAHCIAHGIDMLKGLHQQKLAVETGYWPLFRFDPRRADAGENPFQLDSSDPSLPVSDFINTEGRYRVLQQADPEGAKLLAKQAQEDVDRRWKIYQAMAG